MSGIPTATNVDHLCVTVPDLEQAMTFFADVIGARPILVEGPFEDAETDWMYEHLRTDPRAKLNAGLMRLGPTLTLELYEIESEDQNRNHPRPHDIGSSHISIRVEDLDEARAYLAEKEVTLHGEPTLHEDGQLAGCRWQHFEAPWGLVMEIVSWPAMMPYESNTENRMAPGRDSWNATS